jgi:hypothetical protein
MPISHSIPQVIYLFGHRQGHGKDTCCDIFQDVLRERKIINYRTLFAKMLKKHVAERYGLDVAKMEDQEYKLSVVPHVKPRVVYLDEEGTEVPLWVYMNPGKLKIIQKEIPRTVRDILIEEGRFARSIWGDTWAWQVYSEVLGSGAQVGIVSDYRYPNEGDPDGKMCSLFARNIKEKDPSFKMVKPKIIKVQVYRPDGVFKNDGADAELPDDFSFYDYNIMNETRPDWRDNLRKQLTDMLDNTYNESPDAI